MATTRERTLRVLMSNCKNCRAKIHIPDWKIWQIGEAVNQTSYALLVLWITIMKWTWICHVDKKIFFSNLTIIINQVWLHQKVQTTKEMRNLANYKFTVCWACMAVIKSVCKIVWRAASVLFVFQWYYNRRPPGAQPTFSLNPSLRMALVYFVGSWVRIGIHILPTKLCPSCGADWKCAWCALQLRFLSNLFITQFDLCIELKVYTFCPSFELFSSCQPSFRSVSNLYRSCLRVGQGCTIRPRLAANLFQYLSTPPSPASISNSHPLLGKVLTLCGSARAVGIGIQPWREYGVVTAFPPAPPVPSHTDCRVTAEAATTPLLEAGAWFLPSSSPLPPLQHYFRLSNFFTAPTLTKELLTHLYHT